MKQPLRRAAWIGGLLLLVLAAVFAYQSARTALALNSARRDASTLQAQLVSGDDQGARRTLDRLRGSTSTARKATDGVLWDLGAKLPGVGPDIAAVQTVSAVADAVATTSLPSAIALSGAIQSGSFRAVDGQFDLAAIRRLEPTLGQATTAIDAQSAELQRIDPQRLLPPLAKVVSDLQEKVASAATAADAASRAVRLLPGMLGEGGPRSYLLVVQNNAEVRSTGGLPGSFSVLRADAGKLTMGFQGASEDVGVSAKAVLPLSKGELAVYGATMGKDVRDTNLTPDFPRAAELISEIFRANRGTKLDGVISVDPAALAAVLRGVGSVQAFDKPLTADNVVASLLNGVYSRFDNLGKQNDYFAAVARATFDQMMSGGGDQQVMLRGLAKAGGEHRLLLWSRDSAEQRVIEGSAIAGALPGDTGRTPQVGMYLNDATGAKLQYYLDYRASLAASQCTRDGRQSMDASMLLESKVPADVSDLSPSILGFKPFDAPGTMRMNLRIYAPAGGVITQVTVDSRMVAVTTDRHHDRQVATIPLLLSPGQKVLVSSSIRTGAGQDGDAVLDFTPGMRSQPNGARVRSACG